MTPEVIDRHRANMRAGGFGYSDMPVPGGFGPKSPCNDLSIDLADLEATGLAILAQYCMAMGAVPRMDMTGFWKVNGHYRGTKSDDASLAKIEAVAMRLKAYAGEILDTEGTEPIIAAMVDMRQRSMIFLPEETDDWLTEKQAQEFTGKSQRTLQRWRVPDENGFCPLLVKEDEWGLMYSKRGLSVKMELISENRHRKQSA